MSKLKEVARNPKLELKNHFQMKQTKKSVEKTSYEKVLRKSIVRQDSRWQRSKWKVH